MNISLRLIRAIGCEFVSRKLRSIMILVSIIVFLGLVLAIGLTTVNAWWWLLAIPVILASLLAVASYIVANLIITMLRPDLTASQAQGTKDFVDKFERVTEHVQTPLFMIVFHILRDIVRPREKTFIQSAAEDSTTLHKDLLSLKQKF